MQKIIILLFLFNSFLQTFSQTDPPYSPVKTKYTFDWGNNSTSILVSQYGQSKDVVMIHVHDDETTSAKAAKEVLQHTGGLIIELDNGGKRLVKFKKSGRWFFFDPNRIFSLKGIQQNLHFLNDHVTSAAISSVKAFSAFILQKIPISVNNVIALHNNDNGKYSIRSYKANGSHAKDASKLYIDRECDPDNFFIVTSTKLFRELKMKGYNVVLQNNTTARDDGSLSIYLGKRNITYINVEAEEGNHMEQEGMIESLVVLILHSKNKSTDHQVRK